VISADLVHGPPLSGGRLAVSNENEPRPPTKLDVKTILVLVAFGGGLILLVVLNMN